MNVLMQTIGIIGGGQLGKMIILAGKPMNFKFVILDPDENCPCHSICDEQIVSKFDDSEGITKLAKKVDVITYEFEHINANILLELEGKGHKVYPTPSTLINIQDKLLQKKLLAKANINVPKFQQIDNFEQLCNYAKNNNYKFMLKARKGGYDGKGNAVIKSENDLIKAYEMLTGITISNEKSNLKEIEKKCEKINKIKVELMAEELIEFQKEVSIICAKGLNGDVEIFPVGENLHENSILDLTIVPARITKTAAKEAIEMAKKTLEIFHGIGIFCVELFVDSKRVYINEVAPRPHNSGHYTIEGCITSQYEQHIRAITGLPLGNTKLIAPTVMKNILGTKEIGSVKVLGLNEGLKDKDLKLHIYGKKISKPNRKMGHMTLMADSLEQAIYRINKASEVIKIIGRKEK